jgi:hypothetical protein
LGYKSITMYKKSLLIIFCVLCLLSCRKDTMQYGDEAVNTAPFKEHLSVSEVKAWFNKEQASPAYKKALSSGSNSEFSIARLDFDLDSLHSVKAGDGNVLETNTGGQLKKSNFRYGFRKLVFYKDSAGSVHYNVYEFLPEIKYYFRSAGKINNDFTGDILIYDEHYQLRGGEKLVGGKLAAYIYPVQKTNETVSAKKSTAVITTCQNQQSNYTIYENGEAISVVYGYQVCTTYYIQDAIDNSHMPEDLGGGGLTNYPPPYTPPPLNVTFNPTPKIDPKKFMDCFGTLSDANAGYEVKVLVQEADPGTPNPHGENFVGHVALSLTKTAANGQSITQVVGFYPSSRSNVLSQGEIHDNGAEMDYNVSATFSVDGDSFRNIIEYIGGQTPMYDLFDFNCSSFVYYACMTGGIQLPSPNTTYGLTIPTGDPMTPMGSSQIDINMDVPGQLGAGLRASNQPNVNTNSGKSSPSHGPC